MSWVRIDDRFPHHPKVGALGRVRLPAMGLHLEALCYCSTYLTDGVIPAHQVRKWPRPLVEALVVAKMWVRLGDGAIQLHDYLDYNPSRDTVDERRESARVRMNNTRTAGEHPHAGAARAQASRPVPSRPEGFTRRSSSNGARVLGLVDPMEDDE